MSKVKLNALFHSIGGEPQLKKILRDFYQRMSQDILIGYFFAGKDIFAIADKQTEFLMFAMGASPTYLGKSPSSAHIELPPILTGHFDRRLVLLEETLRKYNVSEEDIRVWIEFENAFRQVVVKN